VVVHSQPDAIDSPEATHPQVGDVTSSQRAVKVVEAMNERQLAVRRDVQVAYLVGEGVSICSEGFLPSSTFTVNPDISQGLDRFLFWLRKPPEVKSPRPYIGSILQIRKSMRSCTTSSLMSPFGISARAPKRVRGRLDARRLMRVTALIDGSLDDPPSLRDMADAAAMSPFHFQRLFRATTGLTPHAYAAARRMERARRMLIGSHAKVAYVAAELGISDLAHFRRTFRRQFNGTPRS
jgi:AraC-like DNA-binding protein